MHDHVLRALAGLEGAADEVLAALDEHLDRDIVGDGAVADDLADEVVIGLRGGRESDLDLLVSHAHEQLEHAALACGVHRIDERLIPVAQVDSAPERCAVDDDIGPGAVRQGCVLDFVVKGLVPEGRHGGGLLLVPCGLICRRGRRGRGDRGGCRDERVRASHGESFRAGANHKKSDERAGTMRPRGRGADSLEVSPAAASKEKRALHADHPTI